jgi:hypothetical protein
LFFFKPRKHKTQEPQAWRFISQERADEINFGYGGRRTPPWGITHAQNFTQVDDERVRMMKSNDQGMEDLDWN